MRVDAGTPRTAPHELSLSGHVRELEPQIRALFGRWGNHVPMGAQVSMSPLRENASHRMAILSIEGIPGRLLVKGQPRHHRIFQSLEAESRIFQRIDARRYRGRAIRVSAQTKAPGFAHRNGSLTVSAGRAAKALIDGYLELETEGLKRRCEG